MADTSSEKGKRRSPQRKKRLTTRQAKFLKILPEHNTIQGAAIAAGYSPETARRGIADVMPSNRDNQRVFLDIIRRMCPIEQVAKVVADGLDAKHTKFFQLAGKVTERDDIVEVTKEDGTVVKENRGKIVEREGERVETMEVTDYSERRQYAYLAIKLARYIPRDMQMDPTEGGGTTVNIDARTFVMNQIESMSRKIGPSGEVIEVEADGQA